MLLMLVTGITQSVAQNVTISPNSGSLVSGNMSGHDTGYALNLSSLWQHEQLSLTMTASDRDGLTDGGEISKPGSVIGIRDFGTAGKPNKMLTIIGGNRPSFLVVSLPKGYRITGYRLTLINNLVGENVVPSTLPSGVTQQPDRHYRDLNNNDNTLNNDGVSVNTMRFYEVKPWKTNGTNSGTKNNPDYNPQERDRTTYNEDGDGYNATRVRYIKLGTDWANGEIGTADEDVLNQAMNGNDGDINPSDTTANKREFYMERFGDDMGNRLYFRLVKNYSHYGISIKSFEILFTAEGTFEAYVTPEVIGHSQHVVMSPFLTSKMELGEMGMNTDPNTGATRFTYNENNVKDLVAYTYMYQQGAVKNGRPSEDVDIPAHITPIKVDDRDLYALSNDTFFIESPIEVETQSGWPAPIGYRIVGATFNYLWGTETPEKEIEVPDAVYIRYRNNNYSSWRYLNDELHFQSAQNNIPYWQVDTLGNIYRGTGDNISYLSCYGSDENTRVLHTSKAATGPAAKWNLRLDTDANSDYYGSIYYEDSQGDRYILQGTNNETNDVNVVKGAQSNLASFSKPSNSTGNHIVTVPGYYPGNYTLKVFDKTGTEIADSVEVTEDNAGGEPIVLKNLNNDAVKFAITGLESGKQALVSVIVQMQALDPYIDKMDIVCTDSAKVLELKQSFTANDFSVSGGKFIFYVPEDYQGQNLTFTFKDLYSKYGDESYYDGTGTGYGRYSYVTSEYFEKVDGNGDNGLYNNPDYSPDAPYENKVLTSVAGNIRFKFNNAEDLGKEGSTDKFLIEKPFSVAEYLKTVDPDFKAVQGSTAVADSAAFIPCILKAVADKDQSSDIYYVFTADETRYNIAPTDSMQHRAYAFYRMDIELRAKTFTPNITATKIYDKTFYSKDGSDSEDSMWGISLDTSDTGAEGKVDGYLTVQEILDIITKGREEQKYTAQEAAAYNQENGFSVGDEGYVQEGDVRLQAIPKVLDPNNVNGPATLEQILYIDGTNLKTILNSAKKEGGTTKVLDLQTLRDTMAVNSLVFMPENTTSTIDNVAYKTSGVTYHAGKHIVIIDKNPFYSPYDIQVDPANYAMYTRKVTNSAYADVQYATVFMPFTISLTDGLHTDADYGEMKFMQMNTTSATSDKYFNYGPAAFFTQTDSTEVKANTPYALEIVDKGKSSDSFTLRQYGAKIVATSSTDSLFSAKELISTGNLTDKYGTPSTYTFSHLGTFSGTKVDRTKKKLFYFANNGFYSSEELKDKYKTVDAYPFRSVYNVGGTGSAKVGYLMLVEGENPNTATGITDVDKVFTGITTGKGFISITSDADTAYRIRTVSGQNIDALNLKAGESRTVYVPAGIYIVNGLKVLVK